MAVHRDICKCPFCKAKRGEHKSWNKGLTKETDERLKKSGNKISTSKKGKCLSDVHKSNIGRANLGHFVTEETRGKIGLRHRGMKHSGLAKLKISEGLKGTIPWNKGKHWSDTIRKKMSLSHIGQIAWNKGKKCEYVTKRNLENNPMKNLKIKEMAMQLKKETLSKSGNFICDKCNKNFYIYGKFTTHKASCGCISWSRGLTKETDSRVKKMAENNSLTKVRLIKEGKYNLKSCYKSGYFFSKKNNKNLHYRSSYELLAYQILEAQSKVIKYENEVVIIPYEYNASIHNYTVDILIYYNDNTKELIEVKPFYKLEDKQIKCKIQAGKKYALENNMQFNIWTEKELFKNKEVHCGLAN